VTVHKPLAIFASALVMGIAVNAMHFTGMSAMSVTEHAPGDLTGATATSMIVPIGATVVFGIIGLAYALMAAPTDEDREAIAYLAARREAASLTGSPSTTGVFPRPTVAPAPARQPEQPQRGASALGGGNWTYRDRSR